MRKLLWPARIGLVTLALVFVPAEAGDGRLSGAALCASETEDGDCKEETDAVCERNPGEYVLDARAKS